MLKTVVCVICGKTFKQINQNHLNGHSISLKEYRTRFPDAPIFSDGFRERIAETASARWKDPKYKKRVGDAISDARSTPEARARESAKQKKLWDDPEYRASQTKKVRKNQQSPKRKKAAREAMTRKWEGTRP